jgi:thiol-disulfide isomerase/thioredoxin
MNRSWTFAGVLSTSLVASTLLWADEPSPAAPSPDKTETKTDEIGKEALARYTVPDTDVEGLVKYIEELRTFQPGTAEEALLHRRKAAPAIREAAEKILKQEKDTKSEAYRTAKSITLGSEVRSLITATEDERRDFVKQVTDLLKSGEPTRQQAQLAMQTASMLEGVDPKLASESYKTFGAILEKASDKQLARNGQRMAGAARRMQLPGHAMELQGKTVAGDPINLADLKGKVVLVDFWATWCGPCLAEIPNMKKLYEKYHDQGFEIVGVSLDQDREALEEFLAAKKLPWTIVHDPENEGQHPAATYYGVFGIPTMILVGRDGKVIDTHARGENLEKLLEKQFDEEKSDDNSEK